MAMTAEVKDELSRLVVTQVSCRKAEVSALLRFAGGLHIVGGRVVVEAEVDLGSRRDVCAGRYSTCSPTVPMCTYSVRAGFESPLATSCV